MNKFKSQPILKVMKEEFLLTKGAGKFLIIAMFFNIPFWGFVPWVSQAVTIIVLAFFLKHIISNDEKIKKAIKSHSVSHKIKPVGKYLVIFTMAYQLPFFWAAFVVQIVTLFFLGIIYATMTKYKE
jgi:hypothetical protein